MALEYRIRYAGEPVNGADRPVADFDLELEAGTVGSFSFTLPPQHPMARQGFFRCEDPGFEVTFSERYASGEEAELFRGWVSSTRLDTDLMLEVSCEGMLAYLSDTRVRPFACRVLSSLPSGTRIIHDDPFAYLVAEHNLHCQQGARFEVGLNSHVGPIDAVTDYGTTWEVMNDAFCDGQDRYLHATSDDWGNRVLNLLDGGYGYGTQAVVLGENIVEMGVETRHERVTTAIIARGTTDDAGADSEGGRVERRDFGLDEVDLDKIVGDASSVSFEGDRAVNWDMVGVHGLHEEKRDYEAKTPGELAAMVAADLNPSELGEREVRALDVRAVDLHSLNPAVQPLRFLDWCEIFIRAERDERLIAHEWLPLTKLSLRPRLEDSSYHFGDLEQTLTRKSALRLGALRRGNGTLVRRTDGTEWNSDRFWNRTDEVEGEIPEIVEGAVSDATDAWSAHLDEETGRWYDSLDEVQREDAQGREELLKHMDELEGKWSDEVGRIDDDLAEAHRELLDGLRDVAVESQRTFFAVCDTPSSTSAKVVYSQNITRPGDEEFQLAKGCVIDVRFTYGNQGAATLNIAATGARAIMTNGLSYGIWLPGQVVRFLYDGTNWLACSTDIYGRSITVGNPAQANFYTDGNSADLRIGSTSYLHSGMDGQRIGLLNDYHIDIGSSDIAFEDGRDKFLGMSLQYDAAHIDAASNLYLTAANEAEYIMMLSTGVTIGRGNVGDLRIDGIRWYANNRPIITGSYVFQGNGTDTLDLPWSSWVQTNYGTGNFLHYAFTVTNGSINENTCYPIGWAVDRNTLHVKFDRAVSGPVRLNIMGFPAGDFMFVSDPVPDFGGPEAFGDAGGGDGPTEGDEPTDDDTEVA